MEMTCQYGALPRHTYVPPLFYVVILSLSPSRSHLVLCLLTPGWTHRALLHLLARLAVLLLAQSARCSAEQRQTLISLSAELHFIFALHGGT